MASGMRLSPWIPKSVACALCVSLENLGREPHTRTPLLRSRQLVDAIVNTCVNASKHQTSMQISEGEGKAATRLQGRPTNFHAAGTMGLDATMPRCSSLAPATMTSSRLGNVRWQRTGRFGPTASGVAAAAMATTSIADLRNLRSRFGITARF